MPRRKEKVMTVRRKCTAKEAREIAKRRGVEIDDEQKTYYATDKSGTEIWSFDTKQERDAFVSH